MHIAYVWYMYRCIYIYIYIDVYSGILSDIFFLNGRSIYFAIPSDILSDILDILFGILSGVCPGPGKVCQLAMFDDIRGYLLEQ